MRTILSRIRQQTFKIEHPTRRDRDKLRTTVVQQLTGEVRRETFVTSHVPKATPQVSEPIFCMVCHRATRHRHGQCQEHDVKFCDVCKKMTARTANDKCAEHVVSNQFCHECGSMRNFVNGVCPQANTHPAAATSSLRLTPRRSSPFFF
ncbi:MAG: hypothetical protein WC750_02640 [Patescibacteria group bacterium]